MCRAAPPSRATTEQSILAQLLAKKEEGENFARWSRGPTGIESGRGKIGGQQM
jgi:hypothetical protein